MFLIKKYIIPLQTEPFFTNPSLHWQIYDPLVLLHTELATALHGSIGAVHSSISKRQNGIWLLFTSVYIYIYDNRCDGVRGCVCMVCRRVCFPSSSQVVCFCILWYKEAGSRGNPKDSLLTLPNCNLISLKIQVWLCTLWIRSIDRRQCADLANQNVTLNNDPFESEQECKLLAQVLNGQSEGVLSNTSCLFEVATCH